MEFTKKLKAVNLRKEGLSYSEIKRIIPVTKSTLSRWLKDIELTCEQKKRLSRLQATGYIGAKKNQEQSAAFHHNIREKAKAEIGKFIANSQFIAGLMLYWAEGDKRSGRVQFSNSDPEMIKFMMGWFRQFCNVPENKFRIGLFVHSLHIREDYLGFWSRITNIPLDQFNKPYVKPTIYSQRKNKLYNGTCAIKINTKSLWSKILGWIEGAKSLLIYV